MEPQALLIVLLHSFGLCSATTWRVRVAYSDWTVRQYFAVNELEFLTSADCASSSKVNVVDEEQAIESGSVWGLMGAFDGITVFNSRWNGRSATDWWDNIGQPYLRYLGATGLPTALGCVRIFVPDVYWSDDYAVAVERLDDATGKWVSWGPSWGAVHHTIFPNVWNEIKLSGPAHAFCGENEHAVDGHCVACPDGLANAAGDDSAAPGGTACDAVNVHSFEVGVTGASTAKFATRSQPTRRQPRNMHTASCGGDKLLVSFTTQTSFPGYRSCSLSNFFGTTNATYCLEEPDETMPWRPKGSIFPVGGFQGHVALYQRSADGSLRELQRAHLPFCEEMGTVTATADCSVLAALCISRTSPAEVPNLKSDLLEDNRDNTTQEQCKVDETRSTSTPEGGYYKQCEYPGGFYEDSVSINKPDWIDPTSEYFVGNYTGGAWFYDTRKAYLLEWHTGAVSATPDATALVNAAIGGARYGSFELHINADASLYFVDMKCVIFGRGDLNYHEGDCSLSVQRTAEGGFKWINEPLPASEELAPVGSGWGISCGIGHTLWHVASYNPQLDQWGRWCWTDWNGGESTGYPARGFGSFFRVAGEAEVAEVFRNYEVEYDDVNGQFGQPSDLANFGSRGWVGVLTAYVPGSNVPGSVGPSLRIGIAYLPASGAAGMIALGQSGGSNTAVRFLDEMYKLAPEGKSVGWAKLVHIGGDPEGDRFLLGYAIFKPRGPPDWYDYPEQFMLVEVTHEGVLLTEPVRVDNAGWSQQSTWSVLSDSGCVAWPNAWADAVDPLGRGPSNWYTEYGSAYWDANIGAIVSLPSMHSSTLRLMTYCPDDHAVPYKGGLSATEDDASSGRWRASPYLWWAAGGAALAAAL